ncbi:MAG: DNA gyrase C-terminal beta-propeller domain-containing protein, partial [Moorellaceae bacterium]
RDESDRTGLRVVIELKRDVQARVILNQLYRHTQMQENFGIIMLALVDGRPKVLNLKEMMEYYLLHQKDIVTRRTKYLLSQAEARAHILEGLRIALQYLDEVIKTIRRSADADTARKALMEKFSLSEKQAQAILDMRLQRLTALEREKIEEEYQELEKKIAYYREVLASEAKVMEIVRDELLEIKAKYGDPRRTQIVAEEQPLDVEDFIPEEDVVITITHRGYIKRLPLDTYRSQRRGGRGVQAIATREEDFVEHLFVATTHHYLLFFTNRGKVYRLRAHEVPEGTRQARGTALVNLIYLSSGERITAVIPVKDFAEDKYLFMATRQGIVKKTPLNEYQSSRRDGLIALGLQEGDELIGVELTGGEDEIILATRQGKVIRFSETEVRGVGRTAQGVKGIDLEEGDKVAAMARVQPGAQAVLVSERGFGKRTPIEEYRGQSRGGKGLIGMKITEKTGSLASLIMAHEEDELMLITAEGLLIRLNIADISQQGRYTQGVTLMRLEKEDRIVAVARIQ